MLSFIVPAYNEELELPATLEAIKRAAGGHDYEIVVVDDASIDATAGIARAAGVRLISIERRQIAAARNAGGRAAHGEVLFFVDADTRINSKHVSGAVDALSQGYAGGGAQVRVEEPIPAWASVALKFFCFVYFGLKLGAGAFLFATRKNFEAAGGFDERVYIGEEVYFSIALRKIGRFKILSEPVLTSGRKFRIYSGWEILRHSTRVLLLGPRSAHSRGDLGIWYDGRRETSSAMTNVECLMTKE